jgi:hypothetical protein
MYLDPGMCGVIFAGVILRFGGSFLGEISNTTRPDTSMSGYSGRVLKCTCFRTQGGLGERRFRFTGELTVSTYSQLVIKHRRITHTRWACIAPSWQDLLPVGDWASPPNAGCCWQNANEKWRRTRKSETYSKNVEDAPLTRRRRRRK